ncbi:response regulator transcription factor [Sphingomonas sp. UV9]|nr:response regulator transcription factor [Sphingomonas sp. UV9]
MAATHVALTPTQIRVLRGVHSGLLNKQIAFDLGIAEATVKVHMTALMRKLNVRNRTQAAILAQTLAI